MQRRMHHISKASGPLLAGMIVLVAWSAMPADAWAQRPFRIYDPFYRSETARRAFYDGYAFTTELSYRSPGSVQDGQQTFGPDLLGLSFRLDYQFAPHFDVSGIVDAARSNSGRVLSLKWLALKYYQTVENTDYAFRLAVDPSIDGRVGFPQMDLAFISTSLLAPNFSSDYALGVRRVRFAYEQLRRNDVDDQPVTVPAAPLANDIVFTRAIGWELHFMMQYSVLLNPARSNVFLSMLVDVGQYNLLESSLSEAEAEARSVSPQVSPQHVAFAMRSGDPVVDEAEELAEEFQGGVVWVRTGMEYNRPSYQVMPFLSIPITQWMPSDSQQWRSRVNLGIRFTLR